MRPKLRNSQSFFQEAISLRCIQCNHEVPTPCVTLQKRLQEARKSREGEEQFRCGFEGIRQLHSWQATKSRGAAARQICEPIWQNPSVCLTDLAGPDLHCRGLNAGIGIKIHVCRPVFRVFHSGCFHPRVADHFR